MGQEKVNLKCNIHNEFITAHTLDQHTMVANKIFTNEPEIKKIYMKLILETMIKNGWSKEDVIEKHKLFPQKRLWRIVCVIKK